MIDDLRADRLVWRAPSLNYEASDRVPLREDDGIAYRISTELAAQAFALGGLPFQAKGAFRTPVSGGNTALSVLRLVCSTPFVIKIDEHEKLVQEAKMLQRLQEREDLGLDFKQCFPRVFALREEPPIFAYLMEDFRPEEGYASIAQLLFGEAGSIPSKLEATRIANALCDALFPAYVSSCRPRLRPSIAADYVDRIRQRLVDAAGRDPAFKPAKVTVKLHGRTYLPWTDYFEALDRNRQGLEALAPPFVTFVHGDPNPENILVRTDPKGPISVRFIDPKEWQDGDYLFDMTKFTHYLMVTGPVEHPDLTHISTVERNGGWVIEHRCEPPPCATAMEQIVTGRVKAFAKRFSDDNWESRWKLGMASNLLGLPKIRLERGRRGHALALYAEGLRHLHDFCETHDLIDT